MVRGMTRNETLETLDRLFAAHGGDRYGESVTQQAHALQCAALAESEGAPASLVTAALLHDIGHMLHGDARGAAARNLDDRHERIGGGWLARAFPPSVAEPVRLHVDAKRYLCAVDPAYREGLSAASIRSLALQGGPFAADAAARFIALPFAEEALRLRLWDDLAKVPDAEVPGWAHFRTAIRAAA